MITISRTYHFMISAYACLVGCIWVDLAGGIEEKVVWMFVCRLRLGSNYAKFLHQPGSIQTRLECFLQSWPTRCSLGAFDVCVIFESGQMLQSG